MIDYYQTISELGIKGRFDTPAEFEKIGLPKDLEGWSVLDIGCNTGAFLVEAHKRGADILFGVEFNMDWRLLAKGVLFDYIGETVDCGVEESIDDISDSFDLVLLLSVTHVVVGMTGQEILDRAWGLTKRLLIVEINDRLQKEPVKLPEGAELFGKNKDNRSVWHIWKK